MEDGGDLMYNGYANQDEFHKALAEGFQAYAEAYEKGMRENPEGWRHAGCDHANGYCSG
jgi:hypothetical protein